MDIGERGFTRLASKLLSRRWLCKRLPPGDDASCIELGPGTLIVKIDGGSVERMRLPWMTWGDVGWKSVVATASDIIAKGGRPLAFLLSIGLPPETRVEDALSIVEGAYEAAERIGAWLAGGDTNASREAWVDVAGVGVAIREPIGVNARPGDLVYTTVGRYGLTGLAFRILAEEGGEGIESYPEALRATRRPEPRLGFLELVEKLPGCITWASDVSDGFCATLKRLEELTGYTVILERLPSLHREALEYAGDKGVSIEELLVRGGEEYEIVFSVKRSCETMLNRAADAAGITIERIGFVVHLPREPDIRTPVEGGIKGPMRIKFIKLEELCVRTGWDQFRGWV